MIVISHRGNINGPQPETENCPTRIDKCIELGYDVEIDIRKIGHEFWLGHDEPQHQVEFEWLLERESKLWLHCKDIPSLVELHQVFNCFFHHIDNYTLTSNNWIWAYPGMPVYEKAKAIAVMPPGVMNLSNFSGVCTDYPEQYNNE
jgi:hypothetical protein